MSFDLSLPTKRQVKLFREKRLLLHLHEQLLQQLDQTPDDWKLHFHLANLLAFSDDASYYNDAKIDIAKSEQHYICALKILQSIYKQDHNQYTKKIQSQLRTPSTPMPLEPVSPYTLATSTPMSLCTVDDYMGCTLDDDDIDDNTDIDLLEEEEEEKKAKITPVPTSSPFLQLNDTNSNSPPTPYASIDHSKHNNVPISVSQTADGVTLDFSNFQRKYKQKHSNNVDDKYTNHFLKNNPINTNTLTIVVLNDKNKIQSTTKCTYQSPKSKKKSRKTPSIINSLDMVFNKPLSISLAQSDIGSPIYTIPVNVSKGYTQIFYGYGSFLNQNGRLKESVNNLLECASWYNDSFVDPSHLSSLVLPPQFLFQDSVKKRHCINFRSLTKIIDSVINKFKKQLDKTYNKIKMNQFINNYQTYKLQYDTQHNCDNDNDDDDDDNDNDNDNQQIIDYKVYPQIIQDFVGEYIQLCSFYYKLGSLLINFLKYAEAKKKYSFALKIFRKFKMRTPLYTTILKEIKEIQNNRSRTTSLSERERAQNLAKKKSHLPQMSASYSSSYSSIY